MVSLRIKFSLFFTMTLDQNGYNNDLWSLPVNLIPNMPRFSRWKARDYFLYHFNSTAKRVEKTVARRKWCPLTYKESFMLLIRKCLFTHFRILYPLLICQFSARSSLICSFHSHLTTWRHSMIFTFWGHKISICVNISAKLR